MTEELVANGNTTDRFERVYIQLVTGEPQAEYFEIPTGFVERPPSEARRLAAAALGRPPSESAARSNERLDAKYFQMMEAAKTERGHLPAEFESMLNRRRAPK